MNNIEIPSKEELYGDCELWNECRGRGCNCPCNTYVKKNPGVMCYGVIVYSVEIGKNGICEDDLKVIQCTKERYLTALKSPVPHIFKDNKCGYIDIPYQDLVSDYRKVLLDEMINYRQFNLTLQNKIITNLKRKRGDITL